MGITYGYDPKEDYSRKMAEAAASGDYAAAARYEQQRNEKILGEGLSYETTNQYYQYLPNSDKMADIFDQIQNRPAFNYDLNGDLLYQQYKDSYTAQGKLAMQDTMGQAAALTGGYGNSYAQTVGQQAYQSYLGKLNDVIPELYQLAYDRYTQEGDDLWRMYNAYADRANEDYNRAWNEQKFAYQQEWDERNFAYQQERDERNFAYQQEWDERNFAYQQAQDEKSLAYRQGQDAYQQSQDARKYAYNLALSMLQSGAMPSEDLLTAAGISPENARAIYERALAASASKSSSSGSASKSSSSGGSSGGSSSGGKILPLKDRTALAEQYVAGGDSAIAAAVAAYKAQGYDTTELLNWLYTYYKYQGKPSGGGGGGGGTARASTY